MTGVQYCFTCWPGGPVTPPPCLRCGARDGYFATGLCERCHRDGDPGVDSCLDCLAWGARRTHGWLCRACVTWRAHYGDPARNGGIGTCLGCGRVLTLGGRGVCRLCHRQASMTRRPPEPLDVIGANRHGQQLFFADMLHARHTPTPPAVNPPPADEPDPAGPRAPVRHHWLNRTTEQLQLFTLAPDLRALGRAGLHRLAHPDDSRPLEAIAHQVADANKWSSGQRRDAIIGTRIMLGVQAEGRAPIRASEVEALRDIDLAVWTVLEVLSAAGALIEDRAPALDRWVTERLTGLPEPMASELRTWFDVMKNGCPTPPRRRPRSHQTITAHLQWALPLLTQWAAAGHTSLREISKEHVLDTLPTGAAQRARAGQGIKSIFRVLKARKVLFVDPTSRVKTGEHPTNQPIPLSDHHIRRIRDLLLTGNPATQLVVALVAFHGIRKSQLQRIRLTDIVDGRLHVDGRVMPLADPVRERLTAWLDHRAATWPETPNDHLFITRRSAYRGDPVSLRWIRLTIGLEITHRQLREDRIVAEAHATNGDVRAIADLFGLSINASTRYANAANDPDLTTDDDRNT